MAKITRLSAEQRENLTAYLDGELDDAQTQEIEQVLAASEVARHEIDMLSRTCDALSVLPTHKASGEFTRKTMTNLRAAESSEPSATAEQCELREREIANKSEAERARLQRNFKTFRELPPDEQKKLRRLDLELKEDTRNLGSLRVVMNEYYDWLATLTPGQQQDLRD